ncbi:unnamed protein product, partial [Symbiodinium necroappetens]
MAVESVEVEEAEEPVVVLASGSTSRRRSRSSSSFRSRSRRNSRRRRGRSSSSSSSSSSRSSSSPSSSSSSCFFSDFFLRTVLHRGPLDEPVGAPQESLRQAKRDKALHGSLVAQDEDVVMIRAAIPSQGMGHLACPDDSADSSTDEAPVELRFHEPTAVRMRFFNFNMANIAALDPFVGMFAQFLEQPFSDGAPVDLAFVALTEARFKMRGFVEEQLEAWHRKPPASGLDTLVHRDALRKKTTSIYNPFSWCRKKLVQRVVGNVKTVLGFRQELFQVEQGETRLDGAFTLNPEKALLGSSIVRRGDGLRLCFFGTHFPMRRLQMVLTSSLEASEKLMAAKIEYARVLREVLCKVMAWELTKQNTVIFVQGDLNSRTVFDDHESGGSQAKDVLLEVLNDASLMAAISSDLRLPHGRWHE